jgi:hypothetical protein
MPMSPSRIDDRESGSTLFLFPVGLLIVLLLGAVAIDLGNVWLQQRRLADAADSAVNDAVTYAIDVDRFRLDGSLVLDPVAVDEVVAASLAGQGLPADVSAGEPSLRVGADGSPVLSLRLESRAELIFGRILLGDGFAITATGAAIADVGVP